MMICVLSRYDVTSLLLLLLCAISGVFNAEEPVSAVDQQQDKQRDVVVDDRNVKDYVPSNRGIDVETCAAEGEAGCDKIRSLKHSIELSLDALDKSAFKGPFIHTIITFKNAKDNKNLQEKFRITVSSLLLKSSVGVVFLIIGDVESQLIAKSILEKVKLECGITTPYQMADIDAERMAKELHTVVEPMQRYFSSKPGAYYSDSLFFLSIAIHRVMPDSVSKVVMLDADLKFKSDINDLYSLFDEFTEDNIIGIARDNQPVYRHTFSRYRTLNPGTRAGEPPPHGLTGFNSGVLLLNLNSMRKSRLYNSLVNEEALAELTAKYHFKGHLGDQDFFTLISMDYEKLFYILPCGWNRQLCKWWRAHGYESVFDVYYDCNEFIHILHGNCNTPIPDD